MVRSLFGCQVCRHTVTLLLYGGDAHLDGKTSHSRKVADRTETGEAKPREASLSRRTILL